MTHELVRQAMGLPEKEPEDEKPRVPAYNRADDVPKYIPLAPQVRANIRRIDKDPRQLSWDVARDPKSMLAAIKGSGSVLLPVARFMDETKRALDRATGGHAFAIVSQQMQSQALYSSARLLHKGDVDGAVDFLMPIRRLLTPGASGSDGREGVYAALCAIIRTLYPNAPEKWNTMTAPSGPAPTPLPLDVPPALENTP